MGEQHKPTYELRVTGYSNHKPDNRIFDGSREYNLAWGYVYGNPRFRDGEWIHTSAIVNHNGDTIETLNTLYKVTNPDQHAFPPQKL